MKTLQTKIRNYLYTLTRSKKYKNSIIFIEASFMTSLCFARLTRENKFMSSEQFSIYCDYYEMFAKFFINYIDGIIILTATKEKLLERMKERAREGEKLVSKKYIRKIQNIILNMVLNMETSKICIDTTKKTRKEIYNDAKNFIEEQIKYKDIGKFTMI